MLVAAEELPLGGDALAARQVHAAHGAAHHVLTCIVAGRVGGVLPRDCGAFALAPDAAYDEIHDDTQGKQKEKFGHGTITEKDYRRGIEKMQWDSGGKS